MSLINQMLRDLEQRNTSKTGTSQPEPLNLQTSRYQPQNRYKHGWLLLLALLAIAGIWFWMQHTYDAPAVAVAPTVTIATADPIPTQAVAPVIAKVDAMTATSSEQSVIAVKVPVIPIVPATPTTQQHTTEPAEQLTNKHSKTQSTVTNPRQQTTTVKTTKSNRHADTLYRQATGSSSRLMRKENLREALQIEPRHLAARNLLLQTLLQEKSSIELKQFLDDSLALYPDNLSFVTALGHYHVQQKNFSDAITILERLDSFRINDPQYLALLAASYQQQQQFAQAFPIYQKLTQQQPEKAENWLGLGVCADRLQQTHTAAAAYRQALQKNSLNSTVVDYINQRLNTLPR